MQIMRDFQFSDAQLLHRPSNTSFSRKANRIARYLQLSALHLAQAFQNSSQPDQRAIILKAHFLILIYPVYECRLRALMDAFPGDMCAELEVDRLDEAHEEIKGQIRALQMKPEERKLLLGVKLSMDRNWVKTRSFRNLEDALLYGWRTRRTPVPATTMNAMFEHRNRTVHITPAFFEYLSVRPMQLRWLLAHEISHALRNGCIWQGLTGPTRGEYAADKLALRLVWNLRPNLSDLCEFFRRIPKKRLNRDHGHPDNRAASMLQSLPEAVVVMQGGEFRKITSICPTERRNRKKMKKKETKKKKKQI